MDINIGILDLTENQVKNIAGFTHPSIRGLSYRMEDSKVQITFVSDSTLSDQEISDVKSAILALPDTAPPEPYNPDILASGLKMALFTGKFSSPKLRSEFAAIDKMSRDRDFGSLRDYLNWLVSIGDAVQADFTVVNNLLKQQGIDLTTL